MSTSLRLALFYVALFAPAAIHLPFIPIWMESRGVSAAEQGAIGFINILVRIVLNPAVGSRADRHGNARGITIVLCWLTLLAFLAHFPAYGFLAVLAAALLYTLTRSPPWPLGEAVVLAAVRREKLDFGRIRLWGSLSFLLVTVAAGPVIDRFGPESILWLCLALLVLSAIGAHLLPREELTARAERPRAPLRQLLRNRVFAVFLVASSFVQASHSVFYAYGTLHWRNVGLSQAEIGVLWATGIIAEVLVMALGDRFFRRVGPARLILLGAIAASPRWMLTAIATEFWSLVAIQLLHALSFSVAYIGAMHFIAQNLPPSHAASAQSLHNSANNLLMGLSMWLLGPVFAAHGGAVYYVMAAFGVVGGLAALALAPFARRA